VLAPNAPEGAIASSPERKLFYSSGHWWAFWEDNLSPSNFVYSSSSDEVTWSSPTVIAAGLSYGCECTSVWVSGGTVYYAIANGSNYFDYNSGTLNAGGTIAWSGQTKVTTEYNTQGSISIITDALGDPWVAAYTESGSAGASPQYTEVYEDSGGVWSAAANSPILGGDMGPEYQDGWVQVVPTPNPSSGVPGVGVLYSFIDCTGCYTGTSLQYTTGTSMGHVTWSSAIGVGSGYAEFSATAVGSTIYIAGSLGIGGIDASYYTIGGTPSAPVSIAAGRGWTGSSPTDVAISQGAPGSDTLVVFYENGSINNVDYNVGSIGTGGAVTWGATQGIYSTPPGGTEMFSVGSVDTATAGNEFGVVFTSYQSAFIQLFFASITVSVSSGVPVSITLSPSSGAGASLSGSNFFSVSYTLGGVAETADQTGGTLNLNVDPSTDVNVSAMSSGSGPSEQWCLYLCSPVNFSSGASGASETYVYYQQFLEQVSYSTSGGAPPSNWCGGGICEEFLFYPSAGLPLSVPLSLTPTSVFMDAAGTWDVVVPAFSPNPDEAWFALPSTSTITSGPATASEVMVSGTVARAGEIALVYYHEYRIQSGYSTSDGTTIPSTITLDTTQTGVPALITLFTFALPSWLDVGSSWSVTPSTASVSSSEEYVQTSGGSGLVTVPSLVINPLYQHKYLVTFNFSGAPQAGQSIEVNGATISPSSVWEPAGTVLSLSLTNPTGFVEWTSSSESIVLGDASSVSTTATINGAGAIIANLPAKPPLYPIYFEESGLALNAFWTVTLNGGTTGSPNPTIEFLMPNDATYQYSIPCIGYLCPTIGSGHVTLNVGGSAGTSLVNVQFIGPWPSYLHDSQQTDQSPYVAAQAATLEWTFLSGDAIAPNGQVCPVPPPPPNIETCYGDSAVSSPAVGPDGTIYFGDFGSSGSSVGTTNLYAGNLFALNSDGSLKWVFDTHGVIYGAAPAVGPDGTIYIGTSQTLTSSGAVGQTSILAINPDGTLKWSNSLPTSDASAGQLSFEIGPGGTIYAVSGGILYALTPSGFIAWSITLGTPFTVSGLSSLAIDSSPVIGPSGTLYIVGSAPNSAGTAIDYTLYAISQTGTISWKVASGADLVLGGPAVDSNGNVYAGCGLASICAYSSEGALEWQAALPNTGCGQIFGVPASTPCTIQVRPTATLVIGTGGTLLVPTEQQVTTVYGQTTSVTDGPYVFYALNSANGNVEWSINPGDPILNPPAIGEDGTIYMGCGFEVCAYTSGGAELWELNTQNALGSLGPSDIQGTTGVSTAPAIGPEGTVYVGDNYGHLFAIGPGPTGTLLGPTKITFVLHSPINLLVTGPTGAQAGFDANGTLVNPDGATVIAPGPNQLETITLNNPFEGQYELEIFGTGNDPFTITVQSSESNGTTLGTTSYTGQASTGSEQTIFLGLVGGGQMSMLLHAHLSNPTLGLECTPSSIPASDTATCTATLAGALGSIAGEQISFSQAKGSGGVNLPSPAMCTVTSGNSCSIGVVGAGPGTTTIQASFAGDTSNAASTASSSVSVTLAQSSIAVNCSPSPVTVGSASKCTATVTGASPTGTITWTSGGVGSLSPASNCTLSTGTCSVSYTPATSVTPVTISALYSGDPYNNGSSGGFSLSVTKAPTTTSVTCQPMSAPAGSPISCTASVVGLLPGGTVSFTSTSGAGSFSPSSGACTLSAGRCSVTYADSAAGRPTIIGTYGGDSNNTGSSGTASPSVTSVSTTSSTTTSSSSSSSSSSSTNTSSSSTSASSQSTSTSASTSASTSSSSTTSATISTSSTSVSSISSSTTSTSVTSSSSSSSPSFPVTYLALIAVAAVALIAIALLARRHGRQAT
jgi:hypothetical protein